jgi:hypothetical protein
VILEFLVNLVIQVILECLLFRVYLQIMENL